MSWARRFRIRQYIRGSLWVLPLIGGILGVVLGELDVLLDKSIHLSGELSYSASTASTLLATIVGAMAALTGFVVTVTTLVVQMATGTFSARYMRLWYRDRMLKALLALLIGTLAFSFTLLRRVESDFVPNLGVSAAGVLVVASLLMFLLFLDVYLHRLRPVAVAVLVANYVRDEFQPQVEMLEATPDIWLGTFEAQGEQPTLVVHSDHPGAIQAVDIDGLVAWARRRRCLVVLRHAIGDFVPARAKLIEVFGAQSIDGRDEAGLRGAVALGTERTIEQDPALAIRIMVDIAERALSAAVNDPTTAVQVLNHLSDVLRLIGSVDFAQSRWTGDPSVRTGFVFPVRVWEDYLTLATTEIREYGGHAIQVVRRLRAMLEELREEVRPEHRAAVEDELVRLDATVARSYGDSIDLDRASAPDNQGIGGREGSGSLYR